MKIGSYFVVSLHEAEIRADAGVAFGAMPRRVWQQRVTPDAENEIPFGIGFFLVQGRGQNLLIDAGIGDKLSEAEETDLHVDRIAKAGRLLADVGIEREDINVVILTHLHFSTAGGLTRLNDEGALEPAFPNARIVVQNDEWERAIHANVLTRDLYRKEDFESLLWHGQLELLQGDAEVLPDVKVHVTGGHTKGHQVVVIESEGEGAIFWGDLIPTVQHLDLKVVSALDLYPLATVQKKSEWMDVAIRSGWVSFFAHDPKIAAAQLGGAVRGEGGVRYEVLLPH